jgi:hypothetical protein
MAPAVAERSRKSHCANSVGPIIKLPCQLRSNRMSASPPESGHGAAAGPCPLRANRRHQRQRVCHGMTFSFSVKRGENSASSGPGSSETMPRLTPCCSTLDGAVPTMGEDDATQLWDRRPRPKARSSRPTNLVSMAFCKRSMIDDIGTGSTAFRSIR